jgi:hypothetical protein
MRVKKFNLRLAALVAAVCFLTGLPAPFIAPGRADAAVPFLSDKAVQFLGQEYAKSGINNSEAGVGSYACYIITRAGVDVGAWRHDGVSLEDAVIAAVKNDISDADKVRSKHLAQDLASMKALGQNELAGQLVQILRKKQGSKGFEDIGPLSIYSNVPAFDLLSRAGLMDQFDTGLAKAYILGEQYIGAQDAHHGSWGSSDDGQYYADFMATAEAVRVLCRLDPGKGDAQIQEAVNNGLAWMKSRQKADGSFVAGMDDPVIDTCEVIVTVKTMGMDPGAWQSSEGKSAVDYIMSKALNPDGSFGTSQNAMDAAWVLWACLALDGKIDAPPQAQSVSQVQPGPEIFKDVQGHWAESPIRLLAGESIISGYPDGTFKPEDQVTRNEIAAMMVRLLKPEPASKYDLHMLGEKFRDAGYTPQWALGAVAAALREGLVSGYLQPDGTFSLEGERRVSRAELAAIMARIIEKKCGQATPGALDFADAGEIPEWAGRAVGIACAKGVAGGYPDRTFRAENPVTRAEAASMIWRLAELLEKK